MEGNKMTMQYLADVRRKGKVKTEALKQASKKALRKSLEFGFLAVVVLGVLAFGFIKAVEYFNRYTYIFKSPVLVATQRPITRLDRVSVVVVSEKTAKVAEIVKDEENKDLATYICEKWGVVECKTALAVAKAESGMRCDALNVNDDGSVDFSVFQLNSVHLKKGGEWTLENMANCHKNVDLAYGMWLEQGWSPWVAFLSGSYLSRL